MARSGQRVSGKQKRKESRQKKTASKKLSRAVREKISKGLKRYHKQEQQRREKISKGLKRYWKRKRAEQRKTEQEEKGIEKRRELICKVLYDGEGKEEQFWGNIRHLEGDSIGNILARIPGEEGICRTTFRTISGEEFSAMVKHPEEIDNPEEMGEQGLDEWETELELEAFWSTWFDHMRAHLPKRGKKSDGSLLIVRIEVCYFVGGKVPASEA